MDQSYRLGNYFLKIWLFYPCPNFFFFFLRGGGSVSLYVSFKMQNCHDFVTFSYLHVIFLQSERGCIEWWGMVVGVRSGQLFRKGDKV